MTADAPTEGVAAERDAEPLLRAEDLVKHFPVHGGILNREIARVHAVNGVSFTVNRGEILGVVGESGCGKSTLGKTLIRLIEPTSGKIYYGPDELTAKSHDQLMPYRRKMQIIFQDPYSSLNPRLTVDATLREVIRFHRVVPTAEMDAYIDELVQRVGLRPESREKLPHEFSGGQRQRIGIARALALKPELIIADEPVSALDVSIQAQVLNLMMDLKEEFGLTLVFISHDLKVVEHFCDRVLVMYLGFAVEELSCYDLHESALHPYTKALLGANPVSDPADRRPLAVLEGDVPSPMKPPLGCAFVGRCPVAKERGDLRPKCETERPPLEDHGDGHRVACWAVER